MVWEITNRADPAIARMADDHYSRTTKGHRQFAGPGKVIALYVRGPEWPFRAWACWVWRDAIRDDDYNGWWNCSLFRNESPYLSSELIKQAVDFANERWGTPALGYDTYVWPQKIQSPNPGYCYQQAGWLKGGWTKDGKKLRLYLPVKEF